MEFIKQPISIKASNLKGKNYCLSPWLYSKVSVPNNSKKLSDHLIETLSTKFLGKEIHRKSYIDKSSHYYLVTRAMNEDSYILYKYSQSELPMLPSKFKNLNLKKNDILIAKDAKPGEVVILDKDYEYHMISGGIYKLPLKDEDKLFLFPILKSQFFKDQLNVLVPKGATLKHAGKLFLDCKIPSFEETEKTLLKFYTKNIINFEIEINKKLKDLSDLIFKELNANPKSYSKKVFFSDLKTNSRLDTGIYTEEYLKIRSLIVTYDKGYYFINKKNLKIGSTPKKRFISNEKNLKFNWITPDHVHDTGFIEKKFKINCDKPNIIKDAVLVVNRTSKGGLGEYVGISTFYDYNKYKDGRCNQGFYILDSEKKDELKFIAAYFNSSIIRKLCGKMSLGAKMKELKSTHISNIPIPKFNENLRKVIIEKYTNDNIKINTDDFKFNQSRIDEIKKNAGILQINEGIEVMKREVDKIIKKKLP